MLSTIPTATANICRAMNLICEVRRLHLPNCAALDSPFVARPLKNRVHENARRVNPVGIELADLDELLDFRYDNICGRRHHRIEITRGFPVDEIAPAVGFPRLHESKIAAQCPLENTFPAVELAHLF